MTLKNLSREQQIALGKKITALVEKQIGPSFNSKYQGSGMVAILRIAASKLDMIKTARSYIQKELTLEIQKSNTQNQKNHGSGMKRTILINLSEQKPEVILKVEDTFKLMLENGNLKKVTPVANTTPETSIPDQDSLVKKTEKQLAIDATNHKIQELMKKDSKSPMKSISLFLGSLFSAENQIMNPNSLDKFKVQTLFSYGAEKDGYHALCCCDEDTAAKIEIALRWFMGNKNWVLRLDDHDLDVMVDLSKVEQKKKRITGILYCFPPSILSSAREILARVCRLGYGLNPEVHYLGEHSFEVSFDKKTIASKKIFPHMQQMGWTVTLTEKDTIIIYTGGEKKDLPSSAVQEVHTSKYIATPGLASKQPETVGSVLCTVQNRNEAFVELNKLYLNTSLFSNLPPEKQDMIKGVLKRIFQEEHTEEYADMLLSFLNFN